MNDTSLWAMDNEDPPERSSTPLYPSVAQRISEWTSLTSEQSRLKSLSYNDSMQDPPLDVYSSPSHSAVFSSPHRKYSNTGHPSFGSSSSSLDHSILNGVPANNNSNGNASSYTLSNKMRPTMIYDDGLRFAQSSQTEILPSCYTNKNQNQINIQMLAAELDASRDLNRKLSMQLAKTERDLQSLKIQQDLHNDKLEAVVASRISEILNRLCDTDLNYKQNSSLVPSPPTLDNNNYGYVSDQEVKRLLMQLNKPSLTAEEIAKNCSAMLSYVKSKSDCRINMRNDKLLNDVHSEKMQNLSSEKIALENQIDILSDRLKSLEYENANLKIRSDEFKNANIIETKELRDVVAQLSYENEKLKRDLAEIGKKSTPTKSAAEILNLETEKNELQRQLEREQIEKQELFLQLNTIGGRLAQSYDDSEQAERFRLEKEHLTKELNEIYDEIRSMRERNEANSQMFNDEILKMRNENEDLRKVCEELIRNRDRLSVDLGEKETENQRLTNENRRLAAEIEQIANLDGENRRLKSEIEKKAILDNENHQLKSELEKKAILDNENHRLKSELEKVDHRLQTEIERTTTIIEENRRLKSEMEETAKKIGADRDLSVMKSKFDEICLYKEKLEKENEKLQEKYERQETKWEREVYDLRRRYQEADEEKFQLQEELKLTKRDFQQEIDLVKKQIESNVQTQNVLQESENNKDGDENKLKQLITEKKQLEAKNDELKRLVTVLRRKLGAATT